MHLPHLISLIKYSVKLGGSDAKCVVCCLEIEEAQKFLTEQYYDRCSQRQFGYNCLVFDYKIHIHMYVMHRD